MSLVFTAAEHVKNSESRESDRPDLKHLFTDVGTAAHRGFGVTGCEQAQFLSELCDSIVPRQPYLSAWNWTTVSVGKRGG